MITYFNKLAVCKKCGRKPNVVEYMPAHSTEPEYEIACYQCISYARSHVYSQAVEQWEEMNKLRVNPNLCTAPTPRLAHSIARVTELSKAIHKKMYRRGALTFKYSELEELEAWADELSEVIFSMKLHCEEE